MILPCYIILVSILGFDSSAFALLCTSAFFSVGPMHCSQDLQVQNLANITLKLGPTALFTHLKIILLRCFQFSAINGIQIDPKYPNLIVCNIELHLLFESRKWWIRNIITYQSDYSSSPIDIFQSYSSIESSFMIYSTTIYCYFPYEFLLLCL